MCTNHTHLIKQSIQSTAWKEYWRVRFTAPSHVHRKRCLLRQAAPLISAQICAQKRCSLHMIVNSISKKILNIKSIFSNGNILGVICWWRKSNNLSKMFSSSKSQKSVLLNNWNQSNLKLKTPNADLYACTPLKQVSKLEPWIACINKSTDKPLTFL